MKNSRESVREWESESVKNQNACGGVAFSTLPRSHAPTPSLRAPLISLSLSLASVCLIGLAWAGQVQFQRIDFLEVDAANGIYSVDVDGDGTPDLVTFGHGRITVRRGNRNATPMYPKTPEIILTGSNAYFGTFATVMPGKGKQLLVMTPSGIDCYAQEGGGFVARPQPLLKCETLLAAKPVLGAIAAQGRGSVSVLPLNFAFDVDGDGRDDIIVPTINGVEIFLQKEPGKFAPPTVLPIFPVVHHAIVAGFREDEITPRILGTRRMLPARLELDLRKIEVRDVDQDGKPDIVYRDPRRGDVYFAQKPGGGFETVPADVPGGAAPPAARDLMDVAGVGRMDRLAAENDLSDPLNIITRVRLWKANAQGQLPAEPDQTVVGQNILIYSDLPIHDFAKDGTLGFAMFKVDISPTDLARWIRLNLGKIDGDLNFYLYDKARGRYPRSPSYTKPIRMVFTIDPGEAIMGFVWERYLGTMMRFEGDFNADSRVDLLVREETNTISLYFNTARRSELFRRSPDLQLEKTPDFSGLGVDDLNGDGASDLILYGGRMPYNFMAPQTGVVTVYISDLR